MEKEIQYWTGGAFIHNHLRIEDLITPSNSKYMMRYTDGSFSLTALTLFLGKIFPYPILITDTRHPSYILHPDYENFNDQDKIQYFNSHAIDPNITLMSNCILERRDIIRNSPNLNHVLTGVEVDMLSPKGKLSVNNYALRDLGLVPNDIVNSTHTSFRNWLASRDQTTSLPQL